MKGYAVSMKCRLKRKGGGPGRTSTSVISKNCCLKSNDMYVHIRTKRGTQSLVAHLSILLVTDHLLKDHA